MTNKIYRETEKLLIASGLNFSIVDKKKHYAILINGKQVAVISQGKSAGRDTKMIAAIIRRARTSE